jgi:ubiquinone/menaquinone biosynthesis C-methylase UbiE
VHRRFLKRFVRSGMNVLEVGAGPGRFTRELVVLGARVEVTDLSAAQVEANRAKALEHGYADAITGWSTLDVRDTGRYRDAQFDAVVAFGGPLSYVFDHAADALRGLLRITSDTGTVVASVMSTHGAYRAFFPAVDELTDTEIDHILSTGDLRQSQPEGHVCRMYTAAQVRELVASAGGSVAAVSASSWTAVEHEDVLLAIERDAPRWERYLGREARICAEPGAVDGGTHVLFAANRTAD